MLALLEKSFTKDRATLTACAFGARKRLCCLIRSAGLAVLLLLAAWGTQVRADGPIVIKKGNSSQEESSEEAAVESPYAGRLQAAKEAIRQKKVGRYGMVPVYAGDIADGTYEIEVDSSSTFFKITRAELLVEGDRMSARITISSLSYQYVYMGTTSEAEADEDGWIGCEEEDGKSIFTIPVEALDQEIACAAFSKKRQLWYDRNLVFDASTLPEGALDIELPDYELIEMALRAYQVDGSEDAAADTSAQTGEQEPPKPVSISRADGEYSIEVNMTGGSGRASISSPTLLTVRDGKAYAGLIWSSAYYDYMIVGQTTYYNQTTDGGNSTFEIPITAMDEAMPVIADTTAMGDPIEIEYTLTFYQDSIGSKSQIPQEAAKKVLVIGLVIIVGGGILNHFVKKKRKA